MDDNHASFLHLMLLGVLLTIVTVMLGVDVAEKTVEIEKLSQSLNICQKW